MTIQECYQAMGADYEDAINRLRSAERVERFARKVLTDPSYEQLCTALEQGNVTESFRAAHTLKGISQNLSLTKMARSAEALTEALRDQPKMPEGLAPLMEAVKANYEMTTQMLRELD
jgi:HPt (histidine-containing phosphotransfer) domain-containing protein